MLTENSNWKKLKEWAKWSGNHAQGELVLTGAVLPILEGLMVNLLTGAESGKGWPFLVTLFALGCFHIYLLALTLFRERTSPVIATLDAVEAQHRLELEQVESTRRIAALQCELDRRAESHRLIRSLFDSLNLETCNFRPDDPDAYRRSLFPILREVVVRIRPTLGVTSGEFTLEVYYLEGEVAGTHRCSPNEGIHQELFFSSIQISPCLPIWLGIRAPHRLGLTRSCAGTACIDEDKELFYRDGKPTKHVYFQRFATVPILEACTARLVGVLVLTSMQTEPFASDALDTLQFLSTLITRYTDAHNRCVIDYETEQKRAVRRERDRQNREAKLVSNGNTPINTSTTTTTTTPPPELSNG
jgi:hypothetical protein